MYNFYNPLLSCYFFIFSLLHERTLFSTCKEVVGRGVVGRGRFASSRSTRRSRAVFIARSFRCKSLGVQSAIFAGALKRCLVSTFCPAKIPACAPRDLSAYSMAVKTCSVPTGASGGGKAGCGGGIAWGEMV